jgi:hypothetical protein
MPYRLPYPLGYQPPSSGPIESEPVNTDTERHTFGSCAIFHVFKALLSNFVLKTIADQLPSRAGKLAVAFAVCLVVAVSPARSLSRSKIRKSKRDERRHSISPTWLVFGHFAIEKIGQYQTPKVRHRNLHLKMYHGPLRVHGLLHGSRKRDPEQIVLDSSLPDKYPDLYRGEYFYGHVFFLPQ